MNIARELITKLQEMAVDRKRAIRELDNLQFVVAEHLIKVFLDPEAKDLNGWVKELNAWRKKLVKTNRGKKGKRNYNRKLLLNSLWEEPLGEPTDRDFRLIELEREGFEFDRGLESHVEEFKELVIEFINSILDDRQFKVTEWRTP